MAIIDGPVSVLNGRHHKLALNLFLIVVLAHWVEHLAQAAQIWLFGWSRPAARGVLGVPFPWLVQQEWLHYGYAVVMLAGFWLLRHGFRGHSRSWWRAAFGIQVWHHLEHLLLLLQVLSGLYLLGRPVPTSVAQLLFPRVELHLFYNAVVFVPMVYAMYLHMRPPRAERAVMTCSCLPAAAAAA